eukprot:91774_1
MAMQDMSTRVRKYVNALRESQILFRKYFGPRPEYRNKFEDEKVLQKVEKAVFSVVDVQKDQENIYLVVKSKDTMDNDNKAKRKKKTAKKKKKTAKKANTNQRIGGRTKAKRGVKRGCASASQPPTKRRKTKHTLDLIFEQPQCTPMTPSNTNNSIPTRSTSTPPMKSKRLSFKNMDSDDDDDIEAMGKGKSLSFDDMDSNDDCDVAPMGKGKSLSFDDIGVDPLNRKNTNQKPIAKDNDKQIAKKTKKKRKGFKPKALSGGWGAFFNKKKK